MFVQALCTGVSVRLGSSFFIRFSFFYRLFALFLKFFLFFLLPVLSSHFLGRHQKRLCYTNKLYFSISFSSMKIFCSTLCALSHLSVFIQTIEHTTTFKLKKENEMKSNESEMNAKRDVSKFASQYEFVCVCVSVIVYVSERGRLFSVMRKYAAGK